MPNPILQTILFIQHLELKKMLDSFYSGKCILLAGSTGFLGKVITEKLLFSLPQIKKVYLLVRQMKGRSIEERFNMEILESQCFTRLRETNWEEARKKIEPIAWDLTKDKIIISPQDEEKLISNVHIIINAFGNTDSSLSLSHIIQVNTFGTLKLFALAKRLKNLQAFIHVSSAYVNMTQNEGWIEEKLYKLEKDPKLILEEIMGLGPEELKKKTPKIMGKIKNKNVFSNVLTEFLLAEEAKGFPFCIIRSTLLGAALSEPMPGWVDTTLTITGLMLMVGLGVTKVAVGRADKVCDIVPVDIVSNTIICAAAFYCKQNSPFIVQVGSSSRNPIAWGAVKNIAVATWSKFPPEKALAKPGITLTANLNLYNAYVTATRKLPMMVTMTYAQLTNNKSLLKESQRMQNSIKKDSMELSYFMPFALNEWIFSTQNSFNLIKMLKGNELARFQLDPAVIEWKIYIANFICGIKRYVLKEQITSNLKLDNIDLNWDILAASYFSDIKWATERGSSIFTRKLKDIKSIIVNSPRVQNKMIELASKETNRTQQAVVRDLNNEAIKIMDSLFANVKVPVIQSMAWIFKKVWRSIYEQIVVDEGALTSLQKFISNSKDPIVFVPSHRSYFDMIIVNYVLFAYNIKTPYTATSEKFLSFALVNKILRMTGGFFIKNKNLKSELFNSILTEYMSLLLADNQIIEFFIEGHRSRTGKIMHPRKELLSICTTPYFEGEVKDIIFVPITINYDRVIEGESLPLELLGEFKEKDSIWSLMQTFRVMKQNFGKVHITHSAPIFLKQFSQNIDKNSTLDLLSYEIMYRLQEASVVMPTAIVSSILLITRRTIGEDELITQVDWVNDEVKNRGFKVSGLESGGSQMAVKESTKLLHNLIETRKDLFNSRIGISNDNKKIFLLSYYRSFLHNVFLLESLVACTINSFGSTLALEEGIPEARIYEESEFLANFLKHEFTCRDLSLGQKGIEKVLNTMKTRGIITEKDGLVKFSRTSGIATNFLCSFVWPIVDTYWSTLLFVSAICKDQSIQYEKLQLSLQWFVENLVEERTLGFYESCSRVWIKHSLQNLEKMGILQVTVTANREVTLHDKYINSQVLEEYVEHLSRFRKVPMVKKIGAINELRRALLSEFPKL